jgi:hypothetical protein
MTSRDVKLGKMSLSIDGEKLNIGDKAPDFKATNNNLSEYNFYLEEEGKVKIISALPSVDTSVCELQTYLLTKKEKNFPDNLLVLSISNDLPFAQNRFIKDKNIHKIKFVSDYLYNEFSKAYSLYINEIKLINRAIFVVDKNNTIRYTEYLDQNTDLPDIDKALEVAKSLI